MFVKVQRVENQQRSHGASWGLANGTRVSTILTDLPKSIVPQSSPKLSPSPLSLNKQTLCYYYPLY